jgi:hypothetical protein
MAGRLSALRAGRALHPRNIPGTHFCYRLSRPQGHSAAGKIRSIENNPMAPSGVKFSNIRLVSQYLNIIKLGEEYIHEIFNFNENKSQLFKTLLNFKEFKL